MFSSNATQVSSANYIEDVFSTYLYTGNGSTQTITNGIDLAGDGGLVWLKGRSLGYNNGLFDTIRGADYLLCSNNTDPSTSISGIPANAWITGFNSDGFGLGSNGSANASGQTYASWTFRKQAKFFDVVTYTGNGTTQNIAHNLGSVPGCIIVKEASAAGNDWQVYHRSTTNTCGRLFLNLTNAENANGRANTWGDNTNPVPPTSTVFTVGNTGAVNNNGATFVAYLFAHNAGGFGLTGTDNVISCGSFTTNGSGVASVTLDYEPQFVLVKRTDSTSDWFMMDNMRGLTADPNNPVAMLRANLSNAENTASYTGWSINATGFGWSAGAASATYIYVAIRKGPMKVPTSGTSVFSPVAQTNSGSQPFPVTAGFPVDSAWFGQRNGWGVNFITSDRLRGATNLLLTTSTNDEATNNSTYGPSTSKLDSNTQFKDGMTNASEPDIYWMFQRAPSFFDEVCYTGNDVNSRVLTHNLGVAPELVIIKSRTAAFFSGWSVTTSALPVVGGLYQEALLNATGGFNGGGFRVNIPSTGLTATTVTLGTDYSYGNESPNTYVMYLFASCAGVSKVGSYTGTGTTKQIDCGFTGGARFVLIKRTDSTGDWYVWDTARGIVSGNDPYLLLNSTAAEVTNTDYVDTYSAGFEISSTAPAAINASGGTFIFLAIA